MAYIYDGRNRRNFSAVCHNDYGRKVYFTRQKNIDATNIVDELNKALAVHRVNQPEIDYLNNYYMGDQPILYREKKVRPEVNNRFVVNLAKVAVDRHVAEMLAEPIQYILRGTDKTKSEEITQLNVIMDAEDKQSVDVDMFFWRSICGTSYRFVGNDDGNGSILDESEFNLTCEDPRYTFVAYYSNGKPAFSCQMYTNTNGAEEYFVYTNTEYFILDGKTVLESGVNGNDAIPVIEYPNNSRRLSDIEITIGITDAINVLQADRINGIEQFVSAWIKFVNCEIDKETYLEMRQEGALVVKSNNGSENKADVDVMTTELNQTQGQIVFADLFDRFLDIQGLANREGNSGGDTGEAVNLRGGHKEQTLRSMISEPIIKKSEKMMLRIILNRLRIDKAFTLLPSDVEIQINHSRLENLLVKAESLEILLRSGINYRRAIKTIDLFNDPELVAMESQDRMEYLYSTEDKEVESESTESSVVVETNEVTDTNITTTSQTA